MVTLEPIGIICEFGFRSAKSPELTILSCLILLRNLCHLEVRALPQRSVNGLPL
jgi:hypothetical protein